MNRLLINEPPLVVLPSLAKLIGLNEAIFLQQLHYWLQTSKNERDGRKWVYNTFEDWQKQMSFWSVVTIKRIVKSLRDGNLVITTAEHNTMQIDRTLWYTINYEALNELERTSEHDTPIVSTCYDGKCQVDTTNNQRLHTDTISDTNVSVLADAPVTPPLAEVEVTPFQVEDTTPTPPQTPPGPPSPPLAVQFRTLTEELRTAKNKAALLMQIYILCYGVDSAVTFAYLGKVAKQVGGAGYLAQRLWELAVHPPNGDVLAYILAEHKHKAARQKQDAPKLSAASLFEAQEVPDYIRGMQTVA